MTLSPQEVRGITQLVSGAVEGLKPDNVTIVNQDGTVLVPSPSTSRIPTAQSDGRRAQDDVAINSLPNSVTRRICKKIFRVLLDASIGAKRSAVRVATDMNFDAAQTETETYAPQRHRALHADGTRIVPGYRRRAPAAHRRSRYDHQQRCRRIRVSNSEHRQQPLHEVEVDHELRDHQVHCQAHRRAR